MDSRKIYLYHKLGPIDHFDSIDWARENFDFYDGETSPLWNYYVKAEFARLNKERNKQRAKLLGVFEQKDLIPLEFIEETN